ncbi:MAG: cell division protein FtsL [Lachnospiraceae bacterium]|nr:cell division protein FtsL [Lachnospiraceae bacterium]
MKNTYVRGAEARKIDVRTAVFAEPTHRTLREMEGEKKRQKKMHMSFLYIAFLCAAFFCFGYSLISYIKLQAEINASVDRISAYEIELNNLTLANDDEYSKMVNAVDLEEVKRIAVEELGMVYADENQVITYTRENSDYVRQLQDIND